MPQRLKSFGNLLLAAFLILFFGERKNPMIKVLDDAIASVKQSISDMKTRIDANITSLQAKANAGADVTDEVNALTSISADLAAFHPADPSSTPPPSGDIPPVGPSGT